MFVSMLDHRQQQLHQHQQKNYFARTPSSEQSIPKIQSFPVLEIENQLRNKVAIGSNIPSSNEIPKQITSANAHNNNVGHSRMETGQRHSSHHNSKHRIPENAKDVETGKQYPYRQRTAFSRDPYDRRDVSKLNKPVSSNSQTENVEPRTLRDYNGMINGTNSESKLRNVKEVSADVRINSSDRSYAVKENELQIEREKKRIEIQKRLAKQELVRCKKAVLNSSIIVDALTDTPYRDPCCSTSIHESALDKVNVETELSRNHTDKLIENDYYEVDEVITKKSEDLKRNSKKNSRKKTTLEKLEKDLHFTESEESQSFENALSVHESKSFPTSPHFKPKSRKTSKNLGYDKSNESKKVIKTGEPSFRKANVYEMRVNSRPLINEFSRMSTSAIQIREKTSPPSLPSSSRPTKKFTPSNERLNNELQNNGIDENRVTVFPSKNELENDNPNAVYSTKKFVHSPLQNSTYFPVQNNNSQPSKVVLPLTIKRNEAIAQLHEGMALESPRVSRRKKIAMRIRASSQAPSSNNLIRSKSSSRANVNLLADDTRTDPNPVDRQHAFLVCRSKTSINLSSIMYTAPSPSSAAATIKPNFAIRRRSTSVKRTWQISNDPTVIFGVFDPAEIDRKRAAQRAQSRAANGALDFESAQYELKVFSRIKELGIGRLRVLRVADLPGIDHIHSTQVLKKYQNLQRPKKKALQEYYNDDDAELEAIAKMVDPNAPKPAGSLITPIRGDFPAARPNALQIPRTLDSILHRHSTTQPKAIAGTVLDLFGKASVTLTYGKLLSRATKIAHMILTKQVTIVTSGTKEKVHLCLPGDRVALVYPNTEPLAFLAAFYGCLLAGVVPIPIEVPLTKRDAGIQQFGFLLGSCGVRVALTSESCLKGLPKVGSGASGHHHHHHHHHSSGSQQVASSANVIPSSPYTGTASSGGASGGGFGSFSRQHRQHHHSNSSFPSSTTGSGGSAGATSAAGATSNYYNHFSSSTNPNDVADFKCWPRLHWTVTESLSRPPKDWTPPSLLVNDEFAYVEYTTDRDGAIKGVCVSRQAMVAHCRAISAAMGYKEGDTMVSVLDFKREVGLWHSILAAIFCGMHVHFVPYSLMKINPTSWLTQVTRHRASFALARSRDLHWSLAAYESSRRNTNNSKEPAVNLSSLTAIVVADGANPWSLSSCDQFLAMFRPLGLHAEAICPCAGAPETGTVALRRPPTTLTSSASNGANDPFFANGDAVGVGGAQNGGVSSPPRCGRGILSMLALSHSVVRVDQENSLTSLTLQDAGHVVPGGMAIVVKPSGPPKLCRADEIGEICLHAPSTAACYLGLKGVSQQTFAVSPLGPDERPLGPACYVRSGLVGFLGPSGLVFVIGSKSAQLYVSGRQHSADDLIATVLAVEPMKFVYRGRIAVFSVPVLRDERICVVAEQKPDVSEEDAFNWMVRVLHAIDSIHQTGVYCLALLPSNQLPKTPLGGIHISETRRRFLDGCLHPATVLMCPQNCVLNLPKPRESHAHDVGPAAMFVGNIVQGARIAGAHGRELILAADEPICFIEILRQRAAQTPDHALYTLMNAKGAEMEALTCQQLLKRAERIGALLLDRGRLAPGDHVALIFPPGIELITAFYGCRSVGLVPVCIRPPSATNLQASLITVRMVVDVSKSVALLSNSTLIKLLKSKEASSHRLNTKAWPTILDIDDAPSSSVARRQKGGAAAALDLALRPSDKCYLDFSVSTTGQLSGVVVTAQSAATQCKSLKVACELYPSRNVALCLDPYSGLGFTLWCLSSVYAGHHTTLISPVELENNAATWLNVLSQNKVRDTFCSYSVMEMCVRELAPQIQQLKNKGINLSSMRTCVVVAEERPRVQLCNAFVKMLAPLGLTARAVSTSFGARVNAAICMQGASSPDPSTLYVDVRALRNDRVTLVEKGAPHSIPLMESGKLLPGVKVVIANPETKGQCADSHLGEIWVASSHNAAGYSIFGEETHLYTDHFNARLITGDTKTTFARTGYLGFLHQTQSINAEGELHDAVFVVGALDETIMLRGMRYHPVDIETTVIRSHKRICESAVFTWTHLLVVVAETDAAETDALDLVPAITSAVLEEQHLIVGVVMITDPATVPINSRGEKQRLHLRDAFLKDQLDPIYVAYNM